MSSCPCLQLWLGRTRLLVGGLPWRLLRGHARLPLRCNVPIRMVYKQTTYRHVFSPTGTIRYLSLDSTIFGHVMFPQFLRFEERGMGGYF